MYVYEVLFFFFFHFIYVYYSVSVLLSLLLSSSTRRRFYHQRSETSGQAVVKGVVPSSLRYAPSIFIPHRVQHSHCSSIFIERSLLTLSRFPLINFYARKSPYEYVHSVRIELTKLILVRVGMRTTYQATGDAGRVTRWRVRVRPPEIGGYPFVAGTRRVAPVL